MQSDPKQCLYCTNNQTLHDLMIEICELSVSRASRGLQGPCERPQRTIG